MFDDDDDDHGPSDFDQEEETTAPCPACGAEIYDDAERCPECGHYLSREDQPRAKTPVWIIAGVVVCIVIVVLWVISGM